MMRVLRKKPAWKAPDPDSVQDYWLKNLTPLHDELMMYLQDRTDWLTKGRTVLIKKNKTKGTIASNYRLLHAYP